MHRSSTETGGGGGDVQEVPPSNWLSANHRPRGRPLQVGSPAVIIRDMIIFLLNYRECLINILSRDVGLTRGGPGFNVPVSSSQCRDREDRLLHRQQRRLPAAQGQRTGGHPGDGLSATTGQVRLTCPRWYPPLMCLRLWSNVWLSVLYRGGMIQTTEQYQFLYSTLAQYSCQLQHCQVHTHNQ